LIPRRRTAVRTLTLLVIAAVALGAMAAAQVQDRPDLQLKAAVYKETVEGDLQGAIALYKQVVANGAAARSVIAAALLGLGGCYEKLGTEQARGVYERLIANYPEQAREVATARARLTAIARAALESPQEPHFRKVVMATGLGYTNARLSPDGREMAFTDRGAVWVIPVASRADQNTTGIPTKLTDPLDALAVAWSPDGQTIAFDTPTGISLIARSGGATKEMVRFANRNNTGGLRTISVSRDGATLAFSSPESPQQARVYLARTGGGTPVELAGGPGCSAPAFSPDGRRLAYVHISKAERAPGSAMRVEGEVWTAASDGRDAMMASNLPGWPNGPVWSPDGSMLAFLQTPTFEEYGHPELRVLTLTDDRRPAGTAARIRLPFETYGPLAGWTADNRIGLLRYNPEQQAIYRVPAAGGRAAQISTKGWRSHPRWSRDGKSIILRLEKGQIGSLNADGGDITLIPVETRVMEAEALPGGGNAVSPDGRTIVFSGAHRVGDALHVNIWTVGIEGGQPRQLTNFRDPDTRFPSWSPDSRAVAFVARDAARSADSGAKPDSLVFQIYTVVPDGTGLRKVTSEADQVNWSAVAWSPDGEWIAYFSRGNTLNLIPAGGGDVRIVADLRQIDSLLPPGLGRVAHSEIAWSPDSRRLAFSFDGRLWTVGAEGGAVTEVRTGLSGVHATYLDWSPDGRTIAFTGSEGGNQELWLMEDFVHLVKRAR
jgi:Tol biopolymer transport system component